jgi:hypothetical protein
MPAQCRASNRPTATARATRQPTTCGRPTSRLGLGLAAQSSRGSGPRRIGRECVGCAHGAVTARSPCVRRRGGTLASGSMVAGRWQGVLGEHQWVPGVAPGKEEGAGAHQRGGSTTGEGQRWQLNGVLRPRWSPAAREGGSEVLQLEEEPRKVSDHLAEEKGARGSSSPSAGGWQWR